MAIKADDRVIGVATFNDNNTYIVSTKQDIASGANVTYNVATLLGAKAAKCDLTKINIRVDVLDTEGGSVTNGYFVDAVAVAAIGWKENGSVIIVNQHQATQNFYIRITVPLKVIA